MAPLVHFLPAILLLSTQALGHVPAVRRQAFQNTTVTNSTCSRSSFTVVSDDNGLWPYRTYRTTNATSPTWEIEQSGGPISHNLIFLTPSNGGPYGAPGVKEPGVQLFDAQGNLVWAGPTGDAANFRMQTLEGQQVISHFIGGEAGTSGGNVLLDSGSISIYNDHYDRIYSVCPKLHLVSQGGGSNSDRCSADLHESYITAANTILATVYNVTQVDLTSVGGPKDGWVIDSLAVEIDIQTSEVLWSWSPLDHVPINASRVVLGDFGQDASNPYDWFHMNSISPIGDDFLINGRNTWTSYYVHRDGSIEWDLDGVDGGSFGGLPDGATFSWQHHAQLFDRGDGQYLYTIFADNNGVQGADRIPAVGLSLLLEVPPSKPPTIVTALRDANDDEFPPAEGSYQILSNGNYFLGYGASPVLKEFGAGDSDGSDLRWSGRYGFRDSDVISSSYRAFKYDWHATPADRPILVVADAAGAGDELQSCATAGSLKRAFVSWNGATDVDAWTVYTGASESELTKLARFDKLGFETEFVVPANAAFVQVAAVQGGAEIRRSLAMEA